MSRAELLANSETGIGAVSGRPLGGRSESFNTQQ